MDNISVRGFKWKLKSVDQNIANHIAIKLCISPMQAAIASSRSSLEEIEHFIDPKIKNLLPDPFHLLDMQKGIDKVIESINLKKKICIFGDYDVDGATASAVLFKVLSHFGANVEVHIADRDFDVKLSRTLKWRSSVFLCSF